MFSPAPNPGAAMAPSTHQALTGTLNPQQLAAVTLPCQGHALVLAGAGSGKTQVLTTRMAWLMNKGLARDSQILALTFTNKAAREMKERLIHLLTHVAPTPFSARHLWVGTFHNIGHRLLRLHSEAANLPAGFQILDSGDQQALVKRLLKNEFAGLGASDNGFARKYCNFINSLKAKGIRASQSNSVLDWGYDEQFCEFYRAYEQACYREGVVDFAELLLGSFELLQHNAAIRHHYQQRFRHILIDEFQDIDSLQYKLVMLLAQVGDYAETQAQEQDGGKKQTTAGAMLFAVGDDDQSIYRFRGADVALIRHFHRRFAADNIIRLEQNYRSYGHILAAANQIISHNQQRLGKNLWTDRGDGPLIKQHQAIDERGEAQYVADEIRRLLAEGIEPNDIAVLYRVNAQSRSMEHELMQRKIPYRIYGGLRFYDRQEIKNALAYLRLIVNADDDTAFLRVVNFPPRGIGQKTLENLQQTARQQLCSLYNAASAMPAANSKFKDFVRLIEGWKTQLGDRIEDNTLADLLETVIQHSGMEALYLEEQDGENRLDNLLELKNALGQFTLDWLADHSINNESGDQFSAFSAPPAESTHNATVHDLLADFLATSALESAERGTDNARDDVQLMTVHGAKGLEFSHVFVLGLEEGLFPHDNALDEGEMGMEEEYRLMYVAMTRAKNRLCLCHALSRGLYGRTVYNSPSRFLDAIPAEHMEALIPALTASTASSRSQRSTGASAPYYGKSNRGANNSHGGSDLNQTSSHVPGGWRLGQSVSHPRFGNGVITACQLDGQSVRLNIRFANVGEKLLDTAYAKLTALD